MDTTGGKSKNRLQNINRPNTVKKIRVRNSEESKIKTLQKRQNPFRVSGRKYGG